MRISRSISLPVNNKDQSIRKVESFFRVIPSTPSAKDANSVTSATPPTGDSGNLLFYFAASMSFLVIEKLL